MGKKISYLLASSVLFSAGCPLGYVFADDGLKYYKTGVTVQNLLLKIGDLAWMIFALVAVICFVTAGIMFLTAQGEPEKLKAARSSVNWGVLGIVVAIFAYSVVTILRTFLGV